MKQFMKFISVKLKSIIYTEGTGPLVWSVMLPVFFLQFFNSMSMTAVFSFLPKLVKSFGTSEADAGYKVGMIASSLFIGRIFSSLIWGHLADRYGGKPAIIATAILSSVFTIAFGFTWNIEWAIITRLLLGLSMGMIIIAKTLIFNYCDDTNSSLGMSFVTGGYASGLVVGPVIGGFLAFPGDLYPTSFSPESTFSRFAILLPCFVVATGYCLATISGIVFIPKPQQRAKPKTIINNSNEEDEVKSNYDESTYLLETEIKKDGLTATKYTIQITKSEVLASSNYRSRKNSIGFKNTQLGKLIENKECLLVCMLYGIYSFIGIGVDELFPLYAATATEYDGFGFSTSEIGMSLMIAAGLVFILQFTFMPRVIRIYGLKKSFLYSCAVMAITTPILPLTQTITNKYIFWATMLLTFIILRFCVAFGFLIVNVLINNSSEASLVGFVNGFAFTLSTIGRAITVPMVGSIFAWSLKNVNGVVDNKHPLGFPFNQYLIFFVLAFISIFNALYVLLLPESLNKKKVVKT